MERRLLLAERMTKRLQELIDQIRSEMEELTGGGRVETFDAVVLGYCRECGAETHGRECNCRNGPV